MSASPFRRFAHRVLMGSGPALLVLAAIYQLLVWQSERLWFESLGYGAHFTRLFAWRAGAFGAGALLLGLWLGLNAQIAWRNAARRAVPLSFFQSDDANRLIPLEDKLHLDRYRRRATVVVVVSLAWLAGLGFSARYALFVGAFGLQSSGIRDTASNFDLAFFLFALPFYAYLSRFVLLSLVLALLLVAAIYWYEEITGTTGPRVDHLFPDSDTSHPSAARLSRPAARHLAILWALLLLWKGCDCVLSVPQSFVSSGNVAARVFDPLDINFGWTSAGLFAFSAPLIALLSGLSLARRPRLRTFALGLAWMIGAGVVPALLPMVVGRSDKNLAWTDALTRHINSTRRAWNLDSVAQRNFVFTSGTKFRAVSPQEVATGAPLALWPARAARDAFNRRLEAERSDLRVAQVWLERAGQTLVYNGLALPPQPTASTAWRAQHERTARGIWLQLEASRTARGGAPILRPALAVSALLGAADAPDAGATPARVWTNQSPADEAIAADHDTWILLSTRAAPATSRDQRFSTPQSRQSLTDGASGSDSETAVRGVSLRSLGVRMLLAGRFLDSMLVRGTSARDEVTWHRGAAERCRELAPFFDWSTSEARPVLVSAPAAGSNFGAPRELKWLVPGLVWSDDYPDSATLGVFGAVSGLAPRVAGGAAPSSANYGRQVAAGVVDARTGQVTLYSLNENEPFLALYQRAFPALFQPFAAMPAEIRAALRPSGTLMSAQALIWARYHDAAPLSWLAHKDDYRPLFWAPSDVQDRNAAALTPLAVQPSGAWNLIAYARLGGQIQSGPAAPLAAILGIDEQFFAANGATTRLVQWRAPAPLLLPSLLVEPLDERPDKRFNAPHLSAPLLGVAPNLNPKGEARGLIVSRGAVSRSVARSDAAGGTNSPLQLEWALQISGPAPKIARQASSLPLSAALQLQRARAAWHALRAARQNANWEGVARAEKRLGTILESSPKVPTHRQPARQSVTKTGTYPGARALAKE